MAGNIYEATDATFPREVLEAGQPVLVDFWAPWCGPCRAMGPVLDQLAAEHGGRVKFVKVNVDQNPQVAGRYGIQGIPTLMFFHRGQKVGELVGLHPSQTIERELRDLCQVAGVTGVPGSSGSRIIQCPQCGQKNRVPLERLSQAICGRCHASLAGVSAGQ